MPDTLNPSLTESTSPHLDTAATRAVLLEVMLERRHQIDDHGWTPDHDDLHGLEDFAWLCARRAVEMSHRDAVQVADARRLFVEIAAIAVAAIEAVERWERRR
jgi:hypothetical protein